MTDRLYIFCKRIYRRAFSRESIDILLLFYNPRLRGLVSLVRLNNTRRRYIRVRVCRVHLLSVVYRRRLIENIYKYVRIVKPFFTIFCNTHVDVFARSLILTSERRSIQVTGYYCAKRLTRSNLDDENIRVISNLYRPQSVQARMENRISEGFGSQLYGARQGRSLVLQQNAYTFTRRYY